MPLKFGIIGVGNIGSAHAKALFEGKVHNALLHAVCDIDPEKRKWVTENFPGVPVFADNETFFARSGAQAVILAVPHYFHPPYAMAGFKAGMHVLTEKPAGVQVSAVKAMNDAAKASGKTFGIMFNQRTDPMYAEVRRLVREEAIGKPLRLLWEATTWFRTQEYYDSGNWRATWTGEGGGVLMNQAPHQLDLMQWIFGLPQTVSAQCHVGKYHEIEVEDDATLYCTYENGATALFHTSTGEEHGVNRLEIIGTEGRILAEDRTVTVYDKKEIRSQKSYPDRGGQHVGILNDFVTSVETGSPLLAPGYEGINEAELCNAAYLSAWTKQEAAIPTNTAAFDSLLEQRKATSRQKELFSPEISDGEYKERWCKL